MSKKYFWKNDTGKVFPDGSVYIDGWHYFCECDTNQHQFQIEEVALVYKEWPEAKRQALFNGVKYIFSGCADGRSFGGVLKADNIEDARKEFEEWYAQHLKERAESLRAAAERAAEEYAQFVQEGVQK